MLSDPGTLHIDSKHFAPCARGAHARADCDKIFWGRRRPGRRRRRPPASSRIAGSGRGRSRSELSHHRARKSRDGWQARSASDQQHLQLCAWCCARRRQRRQLNPRRPQRVQRRCDDPVHTAAAPNARAHARAPTAHTQSRAPHQCEPQQTTGPPSDQIRTERPSKEGVGCASVCYLHLNDAHARTRAHTRVCVRARDREREGEIGRERERDR